MRYPASRRTTITLAILLVAGLTLAVLVAGHVALSLLKTKIEAALGPNTRVGSVEVSLLHIELRDVHVRAAGKWPTQDEISAQSVVIDPYWRDLLNDRPLRIGRVVIADGVISVVRRKDGAIEVAPSFLAALKASGDSEPAPHRPAITIGALEFTNFRLEFFDASVRQPPLHLVFDRLSARVGRIELNAPEKPIDFDVRGSIRSAGPKLAPGTVILSGTMVPATGDARIITRIHGADVVALEPYLLRAGEAGVESGVLDLDLEAVVRSHRLHAPGTLTFSHLVLARSSGVVGTFMGMSREAAIANLKNAKGQVTVHFTLDGNLDDPHFSVNESLSTRVGVALAQALGVSIGGVAKALGALGEKSVEAVGHAAQGVGGAVERLFGK